MYMYDDIMMSILVAAAVYHVNDISETITVYYISEIIWLPRAVGYRFWFAYIYVYLVMYSYVRVYSRFPGIDIV